MSLSPLSSNAPLQRRPLAAPVARVAPAAAAPAAPIKAQAKAPGQPGKFADLEAYKAYVMGSEATRLPAARATVASAEGALATANRALSAKQASVNHDGLKAALDRAEAALTTATYPFRPQAAAKRAEAERMNGEITTLARQITGAQQQIAQAEGRKAARNRDWVWGDDQKDGWDIVFDGLGALGDAASISAAKKKVNDLVAKKVDLDLKVASLVAEAAVLHEKQAEPAAIAPSRQARDAAQQAFDGAVAQEAPEQKVVDDAKADLGRAKGELARLDGVKKDLMDYSQQFGFFTRVKLFFTDWAWKKDLNQFWASKGL